MQTIAMIFRVLPEILPAFFTGFTVVVAIKDPFRNRDERQKMQVVCISGSYNSKQQKILLFCQTCNTMIIRSVKNNVKVIFDDNVNRKDSKNRPVRYSVFQSKRIFAIRFATCLIRLKYIQVFSVHDISVIPCIPDFIQYRSIAPCHLGGKVFVVILYIHMVNPVIRNEQFRICLFCNTGKIRA